MDYLIDPYRPYPANVVPAPPGRSPQQFFFSALQDLFLYDLDEMGHYFLVRDYCDDNFLPEAALVSGVASSAIPRYDHTSSAGSWTMMCAGRDVTVSFYRNESAYTFAQVYVRFLGYDDQGRGPVYGTHSWSTPATSYTVEPAGQNPHWGFTFSSGVCCFGMFFTDWADFVLQDAADTIRMYIDRYEFAADVAPLDTLTYDARDWVNLAGLLEGTAFFFGFTGSQRYERLVIRQVADAVLSTDVTGISSIYIWDQPA